MLIYSNYTYIQVLDDAMTIKLLNRQINLRKLGYEKEKKITDNWFGRNLLKLLMNILHMIPNMML